jgi:hypothetical protein
MGMVTGLGVKTPFEYSIVSAVASFLLPFLELTGHPWIIF